MEDTYTPTSHPQDRACDLIMELWRELADEERPDFALHWITDVATRMHRVAMVEERETQEALKEEVRERFEEEIYGRLEEEVRERFEEEIYGRLEEEVRERFEEEIYGRLEEEVRERFEQEAAE